MSHRIVNKFRNKQERVISFLNQNNKATIKAIHNAIYPLNSNKSLSTTTRLLNIMNDCNVLNKDWITEGKKNYRVYYLNKKGDRNAKV